MTPPIFPKFPRESKVRAFRATVCLMPWLQNNAYPQLQRQNDIAQNTMSVVKFVPSK